MGCIFSAVAPQAAGSSCGIATEGDTQIGVHSGSSVSWLRYVGQVAWPLLLICRMGLVVVHHQRVVMRIKLDYAYEVLNTVPGIG